MHADIDAIAFTGLRSPKQRHEDTSEPLQAGENVREPGAIASYREGGVIV